MKNNGKILVELQETMGSDVSICNAAWTSTYDKEKRDSKATDPERISELVPRLIRDGHSVPMESVVLRFWMRIPIMIDRQIVTHRICSHNGLSGRYRTMPDDWYSFPEDVIAIGNKINTWDYKYGNALQEHYDIICNDANELYRDNLSILKAAEKQGEITNVEFKRVREVLRGMLPVGGMTERTTIMNLRSFANFQKLRNSSHAQLEIQEVAKLMLEEVKKNNVAPIAIKTLEEMEWKV